MDLYKYKQDKLRDLIKELGLNQGEFAEKINVNPSYISNILTDEGSPGARGMGINFLKKIEKKLGIEESYFFPKGEDALSLLKLNKENAETIEYISTVKDPKAKAMMVKIIKDAYKTALTLIEED